MKSLIKTCLVKHKSIVSLTKSTICTAVILSFAFTANSFAMPSFILNADTPATGSNLGTTPLVTPYGSVTFVGEIFIGTSDTEFSAAGASGGSFDILGPDDTPSQAAELFFDFDVESFTFIYGGNTGSILIEAQDASGNPLDSFFQADTYIGYPAGPITLSGSGIRSLYWEDTVKGKDYAALDNITVTVAAPIPAPGAVVLAGIGVGLVGWLQKRRIV
ncbi:MAG: hypothetical protein ABII09_11260 [Planctomycetota bacterium]